MSTKYQIKGISVDERAGRYCITLSNGDVIWGKEFLRDLEVSKKTGFDLYGNQTSIEDKIWYNEGATEERTLNWKRKHQGWLG